jgi:ABC-2 type transport system permease protein
LLVGLLLSAAGLGLLVCTLLMVFGLRAEVSAWSGVSLVLLLCGVYYPVSILPAPLQVVAAGIPLTHFLEAFRANLGHAPVFSTPLVRGYGLAVLYAAGGYALFSWAIQRARRTGMLLKLSD